MVFSQQLLAARRLPLLELQFHIAPSQAASLLIAAAWLELSDASTRAAALSAVAAHPGKFFLASCLGLTLQAPSRRSHRAAPFEPACPIRRRSSARPRGRWRRWRWRAR